MTDTDNDTIRFAPDAVQAGAPVPVTGWYVDLHGHQALFRLGDVLPACPLGEDGRIDLWRLVRRAGAAA